METDVKRKHTVPLNVRITKEQHKKLKQAADFQKISISRLIRKFIEVVS